MCLGLILLRTPLDDLLLMAMVPALLEDVHLPQARMAILYAMGHTELLRNEGSIPPSENEHDVQRTFENWVNQPIGRDISRRFDRMDGAKVEFASVVLGMDVVISAPNEPCAIHLVESILGALEAFLATSLDDVAPYRDRLDVKVQTVDSTMRIPQITSDRADGEFILRIRAPRSRSTAPWSRRRRDFRSNRPMSRSQIAKPRS